VGVYSGPNISENGLVLALDAANIKSIPAQYKTGETTGSVDFNGASSVSFSSADNAAFGTGDFTVEFFIYNRNSNGLSRLCLSNAGWAIEMGTSKTAWQSGNAYLFHDGQTAATRLYNPPLNVWTHVAFTRASNILKAFYNGIQQSVTLTDNYNYTAASPSNPLSLGDFGNSGAFQHNGIISNFHIVKGVAKYTSNFTPPGITLSPQAETSILTANSSVSLAANGMTAIQGTPTVGVRGVNTITSWTDLVGGSNNGTANNGPTYDSSNGESIVFDGTNDFISTTTQFSNVNAYTIIVWFRTSASNARKLVGFENSQTGSSTSYDRQMYIGSDNKLYLGQYDGTADVAVSTMTVNDNIWRCAVGTYGGEGTTLRLYINGVSNATATSNNPQNFVGYWRIGSFKGTGWSNTSDGYFNGSIGQVLIYHRALTSAEIQQNYNATKSRYGL